MINKTLGLAVACILFSLHASASTLVWTIENAYFADGTQLTGSFTYDYANDTYNNVLIQTYPGVLPGFTYTTQHVLNDSYLSMFWLGWDGGVSDSAYLYMDFGDGLPIEGGVVSLLNPSTYETGAFKFPFRFLNSGHIVSSPVPVPGAIILMLSGLGVIGCFSKVRLTNRR